MNRLTIRAAALAAAAAASTVLIQAQGRGGGEWTTARYDAQRTAWLRNDARLTPEAVTAGEFKFLWKQSFPNQPAQLNSLTAPVLLDRLIGFRGFKALAFVGGSEDRIFSIDTDLARPYWTRNLNYTADTGGQLPSSWECPGGLTAMPSRRTTLAPSAFGGGGNFGGRGGAREPSAVGEPGKGAAILEEMARNQAQGGGRQGGGRGAAAGGRGGGRGPAPVAFGGVDPVYAMGSDGYLHTLAASNGADQVPAVKFLPAGAKASPLLWVDGVVYVSTSGGCGAAPNGVYVLDTTTEDKKIRRWTTGGADVVGDEGVTLGTTGTIYVATGKAPVSKAVRLGEAPKSYASSVVALDPQSLEVKDWVTVDGVAFNSSPIVFRMGERELLAVTADDGKLYLLDSASLGGADHKTPVAASARFSGAAAGTSLATFEDGGARWILTTTSGAPPTGVTFTANGPVTAGAVVAFKVAEQGGSLSLQPGWSSRNMASPLAPIVVNGMVFAVASGAHQASGAMTAAQRAQRSTPAVLYLLDAVTGKELWNSGKTITSFATSGLAAGGGQVYLVTYDGTLYAFGIPMEH
jgi:PQQ-like domain